MTNSTKTFVMGLAIGCLTSGFVGGLRGAPAQDAAESSDIGRYQIATFRDSDPGFVVVYAMDTTTGETWRHNTTEDSWHFLAGPVHAK